MPGNGRRGTDLCRVLSSAGKYCGVTENRRLPTSNLSCEGWSLKASSLVQYASLLILVILVGLLFDWMDKHHQVCTVKSTSNGNFMDSS
jgi:hypothetical protein